VERVLVDRDLDRVPLANPCLGVEAPDQSRFRRHLGRQMVEEPVVSDVFCQLAHNQWQSAANRAVAEWAKTGRIAFLRRYRDPTATEEEREQVRRPLLRSIASIAAALRNTG
jgi:hypothetical protein